MSTEETAIGGTFGCIGLILLFNLLLGGWSVNFCLALLGKRIPFIFDTLIGLFTAEITVPFAIIVKILQFCHVM